MTILWLLNINPHQGMRHGGTLRYTNLSRRLLAFGHRVYYVLTNDARVDRLRRNRYLDELRGENCFTDYFEIDEPPYPQPRGRLSRLLIHPGARDGMLRSSRRDYRKRFQELAHDLHADLCVLSDQDRLFLVSDAARLPPILIDWCDSFTLHYAREYRVLLRAGALREVPRTIKNLVDAFLREAFYGRHVAANMVVSAADKKCLDRLNGRPRLNHILLNGVTLNAPAVAPGQLADSLPQNKVPNRLIFTGSMSYAPNEFGALWFIDHVLPRLLRVDPDIRVVIAGQEPQPALLAKASRHVEITGLVADMQAEIGRSQLYVAPLFSGGGFRNKIVEALGSGTYVIGTTMALEFLDDRLRSKLQAADSADSFAEKILDYLKNPGAFDQRLREAMQILRDEYSWDVRSRQFEALCLGLTRAPG